VVIFNPLAQDRREVVRVHYWAGLHNENLHARDFLVRTADGKTYPAQQVGSGDFWQHKYVELAFPVEVPAMGYAAIGIEPCDETPRGTWGYSHKPFPPISRPEVSPRAKSPQWLVLENDHLLVEFDPLTGGIVKLLDKAAEIDFADPKNPMALLEYAVERPGGMTSWVIHPIMRREHPLEVSSLRMKDWGPYLYTVEAVMKAGESQMTVVYSLRAGEPWVGVNIRVNWNERGSSQDGIPQLAMRFPMALDAAAARYEIPFGSILRTQRSGEEVPALRWADVTGTSGGMEEPVGCAILNDCKYGHSLEGSTLRVTLIRSSYDPDPLPEIGEQEIRLAIVPHARSMSPAELTRLAAAWNHPLQAVSTGVHEGTLPADGKPAVCVKQDNVILAAVKKAEDDDALIFRLQEADGKDTLATVELNENLLGRVVSVEEVDLLERPAQTNTAGKAGNGFRVKLPAFGIASVKVELD
jgi:alpha-mannosidase